MPARVQISLLRRIPLLPGGAVMTLSAIAQIISLFSINNLIQYNTIQYVFQLPLISLLNRMSLDRFLPSVSIIIIKYCAIEEAVRHISGMRLPSIKYNAMHYSVQQGWVYVLLKNVIWRNGRVLSHSSPSFHNARPRLSRVFILYVKDFNCTYYGTQEFEN